MIEIFFLNDNRKYRKKKRYCGGEQSVKDKKKFG